MCAPARSATPRRGIGRLALETGVPVVPVAVFGSEHVRRGWRIRPRKVCLRVGRPLRFPTYGSASPALAAAVTERIWACVSLAVGVARRCPQRKRRRAGCRDASGHSLGRRRAGDRDSVPGPARADVDADRHTQAPALEPAAQPTAGEARAA